MSIRKSFFMFVTSAFMFTHSPTAIAVDPATIYGVVSAVYGVYKENQKQSDEAERFKSISEKINQSTHMILSQLYAEIFQTATANIQSAHAFLPDLYSTPDLGFRYSVYHDLNLSLNQLDGLVRNPSVPYETRKAAVDMIKFIAPYLLISSRANKNNSFEITANRIIDYLKASLEWDVGICWIGGIYGNDAQQIVNLHLWTSTFPNPGRCESTYLGWRSTNTYYYPSALKAETREKMRPTVEATPGYQNVISTIASITRMKDMAFVKSEFVDFKQSYTPDGLEFWYNHYLNVGKDQWLRAFRHNAVGTLFARCGRPIGEGPELEHWINHSFNVTHAQFMNDLLSSLNCQGF